MFAKLGVSESDLVPVAYVDLLERTGCEPRRLNRPHQRRRCRRQMPKRQRPVALERGQHDIRAHAVHAGHTHQLLHDERRQRVQIRRDDAQQVIGVADRRVAFQHFGQHLDLLLELLDDRIAVVLQLQARERRHAEAEFFRTQHDAVAVDHARRFEPLQTPADLRRRQRHLLAQLLMRRAAKALEHVEQREIEVIEFDHEGSCAQIGNDASLA